MTYTHKIMQMEDCDPVFHENFNTHLGALPQYHYQQDLDWYLCNDWLDTVLLVTSRDAEIVASSICRRVGYRYLTKAKFIIQNGPLFRDSDALAAHLDKLKDHLSGSAIDIRISPPSDTDDGDAVQGALSRSGFTAYHNVTGNYTDTIVVNLDKGIDAVEASLAPALRRQIRKARASDTDIRRVTDRKSLQEFLEVTRDFYRQRGVGFPRTEMLGCYLERRILGSGEGLVLEMVHTGKPVAGIAVIGCGDRVIFAYGYSNEDPGIRHLPLSHLLHFEAIGWAVENNYSVYDFGGFSRGGKADGINRFKLGFSDTIENVSGDYLFTLHPLLTATANLLGRFRNIS